MINHHRTIRQQCMLAFGTPIAILAATCVLGTQAHTLAPMLGLVILGALATAALGLRLAAQLRSAFAQATDTALALARGELAEAPAAAINLEAARLHAALDAIGAQLRSLSAAQRAMFAMTIKAPPFLIFLLMV